MYFADWSSIAIKAMSSRIDEVQKNMVLKVRLIYLGESRSETSLPPQHRRLTEPCHRRICLGHVETTVDRRFFAVTPMPTKGHARSHTKGGSPIDVLSFFQILQKTLSRSLKVNCVDHPADPLLRSFKIEGDQRVTEGPLDVKGDTRFLLQ